MPTKLKDAINSIKSLSMLPETEKKISEELLGKYEYENIMELIEDLEDANDLLKAEREATSFVPYDKFRKAWLKD